MVNIFNRKLHPFMDADSGASAGAAASQSTEGSTTGDTGVSQNSGAAGTQGTQTDSGASISADLASQKAAQTPEQNAAFAEMRRNKEAAEKKAQDAESARQRDIGIAKKYGSEYGVFSETDIAEKYGHSHGINTLADLEAALQQQEAQREAQKAGIDINVLNQILSNHPAIKKAMEVTAKQEQEAGMNALAAELTDLNKEYPNLRLEKIDDLFKLPNAGKIHDLAQKGYSLLDAYESANKAEIRRQQSEAARQATLNSVSGKGHLRGNGQGADIDTVTIPDDVLDMYKKFNPGKTTDEYKAHYKQSQKK